MPDSGLGPADRRKSQAIFSAAIVIGLVLIQNEPRAGDGMGLMSKPASFLVIAPAFAYLYPSFTRVAQARLSLGIQLFCVVSLLSIV